jgi:uncharacterized membrane-anchored protein
MTKKVNYPDWEREDRYQPKPHKAVKVKSTIEKHRNKIYEMTELDEGDLEYGCKDYYDETT